MASESTRLAMELSDDNVREMLVLAERLRESKGGELDDSAILAVAEATGASTDYVRLALRMLPEKRKHGLGHQIRNAFLALEPDVRRYVISGVLAAIAANMSAMAARFGDQYGLFGALDLIFVGMGLWNICVAKDSRTAAVSGALFGGTFFLAKSLFGLILQSEGGQHSALLVPFVLGGALIAFIAHRIVDRNRAKLGLKDPVRERQDLLRQLVDLQDKLRSGEESMTFLSLDVVGSTRMKADSDPLSIEFTFNEYHNFVETITKRYGGRLHSTAGDGVTCAFHHPQHAFACARNIQAGLVELNTHRNKLGIPIVLRAGIHTGAVIAPQPGEIQSVNFAHVIDVAAHLQKVCPPGGIAISREAANSVPGGPAAIGSDQICVQDVEAVVWQPRPILSGGSPSAEPA